MMIIGRLPSAAARVNYSADDEYRSAAADRENAEAKGYPAAGFT
jgi:hypothetical protein